MSSLTANAVPKNGLPAKRDVREDPSSAWQPHCRRMDSSTLLAGGVEVVIDHGGEAYRLRLTRQNRLILTK